MNTQVESESSEFLLDFPGLALQVLRKRSLPTRKDALYLG